MFYNHQAYLRFSAAGVCLQLLVVISVEGSLDNHLSRQVKTEGTTVTADADLLAPTLAACLALEQRVPVDDDLNVLTALRQFGTRHTRAQPSVLQ